MKRSFYLLIAACIIISACNKNNTKPASKSTLNQTVAEQQMTQMAVNLYRSVIGQYGGANLANGLKISSALHPTKGLKLSDMPPFAVCGTSIPTTSDTSYTSNDTAFVYSGKYLFTYVCDSTMVTGYKNSNQFYKKATDVTAKTSDSLNVIQQFSVTNIGGVNVSIFQANGQITMAEHHVDGSVAPYTYFGTPETANYVDNNTVYSLTNLNIVYSIENPNMPANLTSGTVSYTSNVKYINATNWAPDDYNSTGTITFEATGNLAVVSAYYPVFDKYFVVTINVVTGLPVHSGN